MSYSDDGLTNPEMEWSFLISVLMMVILTNSDSDFVDTIMGYWKESRCQSSCNELVSFVEMVERTYIDCLYISKFLFLFCFGHQLGHWCEVVVHQTFDTFECGITTIGYHQRLWSFIHFNDNHFFSDTVGIFDFPTATRCSFGPSIWDCHDAVCCIDCTDVFFEYQSSPFLVGIIPSIFYGVFDWSIDFVPVVSESFEYLIVL